MKEVIFLENSLNSLSEEAFIKLFIEDKDLRESYWTKETQDMLDALSFNDENYQIIKNHLDKIKF